MRKKLDAKRRQKRDLEDMANFIENIDTSSWNAPLAVTLNFRPSTPRFRAERSTFLLLSQLSKKTYGNASKKRRAQLRAIIAWEGSGDSLHCHLLLESSPHHDLEEFIDMVETLWSRNPCGRTHINRRKGQTPVRIIDTKLMSSRGWQTYIAKVRSKSSSDDLDLFNVYFDTDCR